MPDHTKPWYKYRLKDGGTTERPNKLLEPGYAGDLTPEELAYVQAKLLEDSALAFWWGFKPSAKRRPEEAIRRVAMKGDPDNRNENVRLVRGVSRRPHLERDSPVSDITEDFPPPPAEGNPTPVFGGEAAMTAERPAPETARTPAQLALALG